jgi:hypothetical protein
MRISGSAAVRVVIVAVLFLAVVQSPAKGVGAPPPTSTPIPTPIIVELFTSEGCSDCPPADAVLTRLASQPVHGVQIIPLGEHVDYWDKQGWRDPFSSNAFSVRQVEYASALHVESPYTPQMIVNGRDEFVGSDYGAGAAAVARAARDSAKQLHVAMALDPASGTVVPLHIQVDSPAGDGLRGAADVFVAVTEDGLGSHVVAGENKGRDLHHTAVVRSLTRIGGIAAKARTWSGGGEVTIERQWKAQAAAMTAIVVFVQDHSSRAILGSGSARVSP